jgi:hypothetical protein
MNENYSMILQNLKDELLNSSIQKFKLEKTWFEGIPNEPGVYIFHIQKKIIYVGESGNLRGRMKDLRNTQNHNLRRLLGEFLYSDDSNFWKASSRKKFHPEIEAKLEIFMIENLYVRFMPTIIGRKEIEDLLTLELDGILNKRRKRK